MQKRTEEKKMKHLVSNLTDAARKRVAYRRTVAELQNLPIDIALDLDIDKNDARRIAYKAVYGG